MAGRLAGSGHQVTYLTLRQWPRRADPGVPDVDVIAVGPRMALYTDSGRRRILPPLAFGAGVLVHLLRHGRRYDVLHTASFPYFALLAAGLLRRRSGYRLVVDWHEVWTLGYWQEYLGRAGGRVGWLVQRACARVPQRAFCFSRLHARRLEEEGLRGRVSVLEGEYDGDAAPGVAAEAADAAEAAEPRVVFAGRLIPEKRAEALVGAMAVLGREAPSLRCDVYGDGPGRGALEAAVRAAGPDARVDVHGFVAWEDVDAALRRAACMVLPSRREGYGLIVVEAAARGCPSVVVAGPDNAATEHVEEGVNGFVAASASPEDLAAAIRRALRGGAALRRSTAGWYARHADRLSLTRSLATVTAAYADLEHGAAA